MDLKSKIILIYGPTASGKSNFAIKLAKKIKGEIVNADSMQVYKELKILSARPLPKNYKNIKHHLYGFQSVKKNFSSGDWLKLVNKKIINIKKKNKTPILVGGTGLYFKAITEGLVNIPNIPIRLRSKIRLLHKKIGTKRFFSELVELDPISKNFVKPTDTQRIIRAYEVKSFTKRSIYDWFKSTRSDYEKDDFFKIYIDYPRVELIKRINVRTEDMIENGAISEVKKFIKLKFQELKLPQRQSELQKLENILRKKLRYLR